jgi:hypothetical protein
MVRETWWCLAPAAAKIPAGRDGDAYVLRLIMHDWNDANCVAILTNLRRAMGGARATLIIAEVPPSFFSPRYCAEYPSMCIHAGLKLCRQCCCNWQCPSQQNAALGASPSATT